MSSNCNLAHLSPHIHARTPSRLVRLSCLAHSKEMQPCVAALVDKNYTRVIFEAMKE